MDARAAWRATPPWARWLALYAGALAASLATGALTRWTWDEVAFLAGALLVFASISQIRLGGPRTVVTERTLMGAPKTREPLPAPARRAEIRRGVGFFLVAIALWATAVAAYWL